MTALRIATENEASVIGGQGTPVDTKCIIKSRLSSFNCRLKDSSPEYNDNQLVAYDHIERDTPVRGVEWIRCYGLNSGGTTTDTSLLINSMTLCYQRGHSSKSFYLRVKYTDSVSPYGEVVSSLDDLELIPNITCGNHSIDIIQSGETADRYPSFIARITDISDLPYPLTDYEGNVKIAETITPASITGDNECVIKFYISFDLMTSFTIVQHTTDTRVTSIDFSGSSDESDLLSAKIVTYGQYETYKGYSDLNFNFNLSSIHVSNAVSNPDLTFKITRDPNHVDQSGPMTISLKEADMPYFWYDNNNGKVIPSDTITITNHGDVTPPTPIKIPIRVAFDNFNAGNNTGYIYINKSDKDDGYLTKVNRLSGFILSASTEIYRGNANLTGQWIDNGGPGPGSIGDCYYQVVTLTAVAADPFPLQTSHYYGCDGELNEDQLYEIKYVGSTTPF